jgi:hypothetical protein
MTDKMIAEFGKLAEAVSRLIDVQSQPWSDVRTDTPQEVLNKTSQTFVPLKGYVYKPIEPNPSEVDSNAVALNVAEAFIRKQEIDTSKHDMTRPEMVQEIEFQGKKAWRVSWRLKGRMVKGGQLVVIVDESGNCQQGWGE